MSLKIKRFISLVIFLLLFTAVLFYIKNHLNEFQDIRFLSLNYVIILLFCSLMYFLSQGLILKIIVEPFGVRLGFLQWFGITMATLLGNTFIPFGGLGFRAGYLKKAHLFDYTHFLSTLATIYIIEFLIFTLGAIIGLIFLYLHNGIFDPGVTILLFSIFLICIILLFSPLKLPRFKNKLLQQLSNILDSWHGIKTNYKLIKKIVGLTLFEFLLLSFIFYFAFRAFGFFVSFIQTFLPTCLSDYAFLIRVLPASFGFYEGAVVYSSRLLGLTIAQGLLVVAVVRIVSLFWIFILGVLFSYMLIRRGSLKQ